MTFDDLQPTNRRDPRWRPLIWGLPLAILALPAVAMRFTGEVDWSASDFAIMAMMLATTAAVIDFVTSRPWPRARKLAGTLLAIGTFVAIWAVLATS